MQEPPVTHRFRFQIAERIRGLIGGQDATLALTAARLAVDELPLRMSIDPDSPYPTVDVIAALVREYGVDPTWLLTGTYDPVTHRNVLETTTAELPAAVSVLVGRTYADWGGHSSTGSPRFPPPPS